MKAICSTLLLAALASGLPIHHAHAQDPSTGLIEDHDAVGESIRAEAEAILHLATTLRAEIDAGNLVLSEAAEGNWAKGQVLWERIREQARAGEYGPAYKTARQARMLINTSFREAFTGKPSAAVVDALKRYVDAVKPRVPALENQVSNYKLTHEGKEAFEVASAMYGEARKYAKKKKWDQAFRALCDALGEFDTVIYEAYPASR
jgi:hypothetical protein